MSFKQLLSILALFSLLNPLFAVNIFECEDATGNITFQDRCPPGTTPVNERNYATSVPGGGTTTLSPLTLYLVPTCDTCNQLKEFLEIRNIRYTEKDVSEDINLQNELKDVAGELQVPALIVETTVLSGYNRSALIQALTESGHITKDE
jgi:glutaredoxin